jgi:hypothetical protein
VLRWFSRRSLLERDDAHQMLAWESSGFLIDAKVCIAGSDRAGLQRLLRYCARPPFALERSENVNENRILYRLPHSAMVAPSSPRWSSSTTSPP